MNATKAAIQDNLCLSSSEFSKIENEDTIIMVQNCQSPMLDSPPKIREATSEFEAKSASDDHVAEGDQGRNTLKQIEDNQAILANLY